MRWAGKLITFSATSTAESFLSDCTDYAVRTSHIDEELFITRVISVAGKAAAARVQHNT